MDGSSTVEAPLAAPDKLHQFTKDAFQAFATQPTSLDIAAFQDDPQFFDFLDEWIGGKDGEDAAITDAFSTLVELGQQFDFQQGLVSASTSASPVLLEPTTAAAQRADDGQPSGAPQHHPPSDAWPSAFAVAATAAPAGAAAAAPRHHHQQPSPAAPTPWAYDNGHSLSSSSVASMPSASTCVSMTTGSTSLESPRASDNAHPWSAAASGALSEGSATALLPLTLAPHAQGAITPAALAPWAAGTSSQTADALRLPSQLPAPASEQQPVPRWPPVSTGVPTLSDILKIAVHGRLDADEEPTRPPHSASTAEQRTALTPRLAAAVGGDALLGHVVPQRFASDSILRTDSPLGSSDQPFARSSAGDGDGSSPMDCQRLSTSGAASGADAAAAAGKPGCAASHRRSFTSTHGGSSHGNHSHHHGHLPPVGTEGPKPKLTRNQKAKVAMSMLEAELAAKVASFEDLQRERASLVQRVEILELAVDRQNVALGLMGGNTSDEASAMAAAAGLGLGGVAVAGAPGALAGSHPMAAGLGGLRGALQVFGVRGLLPDGPVGQAELAFARTCTMQQYIEWYKRHLQALSVGLLQLQEGRNVQQAEEHITQLIAAQNLRLFLLNMFQPLVALRVKGLNMETGTRMDPPDQHWMDVIRFMTVSMETVAEMDTLFASYNCLHASLAAELQDTQRDLQDLIGAQRETPLVMCGGACLQEGEKQAKLLQRVRSTLQKTALLYSSTIQVAAMRILKPVEFAKCCVQSYPYCPCGPSLMKACADLRRMKQLMGIGFGCPGSAGACGGGGAEQPGGDGAGCKPVQAPPPAAQQPLR